MVNVTLKLGNVNVIPDGKEILVAYQYVLINVLQKDDVLMKDANVMMVGKEMIVL